MIWTKHIWFAWTHWIGEFKETRREITGRKRIRFELCGIALNYAKLLTSSYLTSRSLKFIKSLSSSESNMFDRNHLDPSTSHCLPWATTMNQCNKWLELEPIYEARASYQINEYLKFYTWQKHVDRAIFTHMLFLRSHLIRWQYNIYDNNAVTRQWSNLDALWNICLVFLIYYMVLPISQTR